jgi:hypothetical protein
MPKHIVDLLTTLGVPAEDAAKIDTLPEAEQATFDAKPYAEKVKGNYETQFKNDPNFFNNITVENLPPTVKKAIESGQYARATNEAKGKIAKALGFTADEIKDLESDDYKALDFYIPAITEKWTKTKAGDKETQAQLIEARKQLEKYGPDYEKGIETKYQTQAEQKVTAAIFNAALIGELSAIPGLKIPAGDIAATANQILQSKYGFERVGDYSVELRQKANPQMKVLKTGSSQELTLKEALAEIATERGWVEKEEKDKGKGSGKINVTPGADGTLKMVVAPHLQDKLAKKIAAEG